MCLYYLIFCSHIILIHIGTWGPACSTVTICWSIHPCSPWCVLRWWGYPSPLDSTLKHDQLVGVAPGRSIATCSHEDLFEAKQRSHWNPSVVTICTWLVVGGLQSTVPQSLGGKSKMSIKPPSSICWTMVGYCPLYYALFTQRCFHQTITSGWSHR